MDQKHKTDIYDISDHLDAIGTGRNFLQNFTLSKDGPIKSTEQDRDENTQEDYPTTE